MLEQVREALHQSTIRVITKLASLLPGTVALIIAVALSAVLGAILAFLLRRLLRAVDFDERLAHAVSPVWTQWSPSQSPTLLVTRVVFWALILIGFLIGIAAFDATLTSQLVLSIFTYLPNVVAAVLVLLMGTLIARFIARSVLIGAVNMNLQYARVLSLGVKWLVLVLTVAMALEHLSIGGGIVQLAFGILFGGIVLALALAVGLGSKELVSRSLEREKTTAETEEPFRHL
ncbi:MAG: hypothetical protein DMG59_23570 [Acidobacteria bacterium]|nr:MAG: hypothetical protein DMG59_23570 [Acidobacteriota bacterium]